MDEGCRPYPGEVRDLGDGNRIEVVADWQCPDGGEIRVVRWQLRGQARDLYHWARGQGFSGTAGGDGEQAAEWVAGVSLERRTGPQTRWDAIRRQELTGDDPARFAARLNGWEAGLRDRGGKLAQRNGGQ